MDTTIVYCGLYWGCIGIMEQKMETTIVNWGYIGIMGKNMETTIEVVAVAVVVSAMEGVQIVLGFRV